MALRLSLIRQYSDLLGNASTTQLPKATYRRDAWANAVEFDFSGETLTVTREQRRIRLEQRGFIFDQTQAVLHDLISDSLTPLGLVEPSDIERAAPNFLSAFAKDALWNSSTVRTDPKTSDLNSGMSPESVFLRSRFPHLHFEWHIKSPYFDIRPLRSGDEYDLKVAWSAWAPPSTFEANPLVARGSLTDKLVIVDGRPLITNRLFSIENLLLPELMIPKSLHKDIQASTDANAQGPEAEALVSLTVSQRMLRVLRSSESMLASIVALSALLSSTQPLLDSRSHTAGVVLAAMGIASAAISVLSLFISWGLSYLESRSAKRQLDVNRDARLRDLGGGLRRNATFGTFESVPVVTPSSGRGLRWQDKTEGEHISRPPRAGLGRSVVNTGTLYA